jgi:sulfate transport system ATP-binding protein
MALARALAVEPKVLLLDEPFGALDAKVRKDLRRWLRRLHDEVRATTVFVTHDQEEAMEVADRIVVMNKGRIEQVGAPDEVYQNPATPFVYEFLGDVNVFHGRGYARPYEVELFREAVQASVAATVEHLAPRGPAVRVELRAADGGATIEADVSREALRKLGLVPGDRVFVRPSRLRDFAATKQAA